MESNFRTRETRELKKPSAELTRVNGDGSNDSVNGLQVVPERTMERVGFKRYSLQTNSAALEQRKNEEVSTAGRLRQASVEPAMIVNLDPARIDPHLVTFYDFDPQAAESYNQLAVSLISTAARKNCKRILLASAQHGEGRTCVALNLAGALARARRKVLVVDTDLLQPSTLRLLGVDAEIGLAEALARELRPGAAAMRVLPCGFTLLAARERVHNSAELLASQAFEDMLDAFDPDYDFILFDAPPLLSSADAHLLMRLTDTTMLVVKPEQNTAAQITRALSLFNEDEVCGVVLNRIR